MGVEVKNPLKKLGEIIYDKLGHSRYKPVKDVYLVDNLRVHQHKGAHLTWGAGQYQQVYYDALLGRYILMPQPRVIEYLTSDLEKKIIQLVEKSNGKA